MGREEMKRFSNENH